MMIELKMGPEYEKTMRELGEMGVNLQKAVNAGLNKGTKLAATRVATEHLTGQDLAARSGNLRRAVDGWMAGDLDGVVGVRESAAVKKYKWILGTDQMTITPKNSKFLAIPIADGLTPSGVARYASPRDVESGFFFKGKSGGLFFGKRRGKTDRSKLLMFFTFKKSVTVTGSGSLAAGVLDSVDDITEAIGNEMENI